MVTETLEFDNARAVQALYGNDLKRIREMEKRLGVRVTTRDGWLRLEGEDEAVAQAKRVFGQLQEVQKSGVPIRGQEFQYALRAVTEPETAGFEKLLETKVLFSPRRPPLVPKTAGQQTYIGAIRDHDVTFGIGPAGTGKTYLAMAMAVEALKQEQVKRIILTRPAVEAGEALGFLPGDLKEKIYPYLRPLYDALYDMVEADEMQKYLERGVIEIAPLAYMRGRTLNHAFIVLDEAQNTTTEQMFMFLTRLGMDSKCVITGDDTQIDLPLNKRSGLVEARHALHNAEGIAFVYFGDRDVIRHELVQSIVRHYREYRGGKET